jgi:DNA-binding NarL/FixJ family response regulator
MMQEQRPFSTLDPGPTAADEVRKASLLRVLVVDDYVPFRRFVCSMLGKMPELQIVAEISDGSEAVQKAKQLQPDLILLDIGLPTINGIEAARQIRKLSPGSKIIFISQESSADVVEEGLALGAVGYVVKAHAGSELLSAVGAVLEGRQFISSGVSGHNFAAASDARDGFSSNGPLLSTLLRKTETTRGHRAEFYSDDAAFVLGFSNFIEAALNAGDAVIVVSTESHQRSMFQKLQERGVNVPAVIEQGRCLFVDVAETNSSFMENDVPTPVRFFKVVDDLIVEAARAAQGKQFRVAVCGECASILWAQGKANAAIQVEKLCHKLARRYEMDILCGFSLGCFYREEDTKIFREIASNR